jgi:hypothetical protein
VAAAAFIGDWYGFAASVLEELRSSAGLDFFTLRLAALTR